MFKTTWTAGEKGHTDTHNRIGAQLNRDFFPERFGAVGDGIHDDTAALQAAVNAAGESGGGIVSLTRTYAYTAGGVTGLALYENIYYGILVNFNNVFLQGPGALKLNEVPPILRTGDQKPHDRFVSVLFNRCGPLPEYPGLGGVWIENVGIEGITFDNSALTTQQLLSIDKLRGHSSCVSFAHAKHFFCNHNTVIGGFGAGALYGVLGSMYGEYAHNTLYQSTGCGFWLDGLSRSEVYGNRVYNTSDAGIAIVPNTDNHTGAELLNVHDNVVVNCSGRAIAVLAQYSHIHHNLLYCLDGTQGGMQFSASYGIQGLYTCDHTRIEDNTILSPNNGIGTGTAMYIYGYTSSPGNGLPVGSKGMIVKGNRINHYAGPGSKGYGTPIRLGEQIKDSWIVDNFIDGAAVEQDASCSGNTVTPNY